MKRRRGLGKGLGMGYKNIVPIDSHIHRLSAKGVKTQCQLLKLRARGTKNPVKSKNVLNYIMDYEGGNPSVEDVVYLFSYLVESGQVWTLQGMYGRQAQRFIDAGILNKTGKINWDKVPSPTELYYGDDLDAKGKEFKRFGGFLRRTVVDDKHTFIRQVIPVGEEEGWYAVVRKKTFVEKLDFLDLGIQTIESPILSLAEAKKIQKQAEKQLSLKAKGKKKKKLTKEQKLKRGLGTAIGIVAGAEATRGTRYEGVGALVGGYAGYKFAEGFDAKGKTGKLHFSVTGEFLTDMAHRIHKEKGFKAGVKFLTDSLADFPEKMAKEVVSGKKKLVGVNDLKLVSVKAKGKD